MAIDNESFASTFGAVEQSLEDRGAAYRGGRRARQCSPNGPGVRAFEDADTSTRLTIDGLVKERQSQLVGGPRRFLPAPANPELRLAQARRLSAFAHQALVRRRIGNLHRQATQ